ncbi:MAG TPA: type II toxin-antitoxin system VapC family toxin [Chloroflexota bacterium]|jgi:PIN domain nuclease of toxin-antitoxin system|nr:type II toxin-antitoxin system VapC family toxin [Chloroflexota bacterium]
MSFLLDTHVLIWLLAGSPRISTDLLNTLADPGHTIYVSTASAWEIAIKVGLGKLAVPSNLHDWLPAEIAAAGLTPLPIELRHALGVELLPSHHTDPFDRLLIAQAIAEDLTLVSADRAFDAYDVRLMRC